MNNELLYNEIYIKTRSCRRIQFVKLLQQMIIKTKELKQKLDFLTKRENKLQQIEQMFKSGIVDLDELRKIVLEKEV